MTPVQERFWSYVRKTDSCWEWTGAKKPNGYGQFNLRRNGKKCLGYAHRLSLLYSKGKLPAPGQVTMHLCNNRSCVNPDHLQIGSPKENVQQCMAQGRFKGTGPLGEENGQSKLTEKDVKEIRLHLKSHTETAKQFGVCRSTIKKVRQGILWKALLERAKETP